MADILFKNISVITMDSDRRVIKSGWLSVDNGIITGIGEGDGDVTISAKRVIDGKGRLIMPGIIDTHLHSPMVMLRGYADDYNLQDWLSTKIFPAESRLKKEQIKAGATFAFAELLRNGVTSVTDMYFNVPTIAEAALNAGIKINLSNSILCLDESNFDFYSDRAVTETMELLKDYHGAGNGRIKADASIHGAYTSTPKVAHMMAELAKQYNLNMHLHLSETKREHVEVIEKFGKTAARIFLDEGVFDVPTTAAHCVWVDDEDIAIMAEKGVTCAHNPVSNLKLGSGIAPIVKMKKAGVNIALGTDGCASNNTLDMFEEIKLSAILQKGANLDPVCVSAYDALEFATINGAKAQGREAECGSLEIGKQADIIMLDMTTPSLVPSYDPISTVVYGAHGSDVCLTMIQGKILYENGGFTTIDYEKAASDMLNICVPAVLGE